MYSTAERVRRVRQRAEQIRLKKETRMCGTLSSLCALSALILLGTLAAMTGCERPGLVPGFYGATLLFEDVGGYVLAAVLSFAAAVVITLLCIRYRTKTEIHNINENEEEQVK